MIRTLCCLGVLSLALTTLGCEEKPSGAPAAAPASASKETVECLVCVGHKIPLEVSTARTDFEGQTYYFCTEDCKKEFVAAPAKYIKKPAATQPAH